MHSEPFLGIFGQLDSKTACLSFRHGGSLRLLMRLKAGKTEICSSIALNMGSLADNNLIGFENRGSILKGWI